MSQSRPEQTQNILGNTFRNLSFQTRLVLFVLLVSLVPLIIIAIRDTVQTQQALTNSAEISLKFSADQTANSLDTLIQTTLDSISTESQFSDFPLYLTQTPSLRSGSAEQAMAQNLLNKLSSKDPVNIISYALVDTNGNVLLDSTGQNIHKNESKEAYFPQIQFAAEPIVTAVTYSDDKKTILTFASKVLNTNGNYVGILRIKYNSSVLQNVVVKSSGGSADTLVLLLDPLYIRLADSRNRSFIQKSVTPLNLVNYLLAVESGRFLDIPREEQSTNFPDFAYALDNAAQKPIFRVDITPNLPGDDTVAVAFMKTQPWIVTYSKPTPNFLAEVQKQTRTNTILVIGASILITLITALVARSLTNPISALTKTANSISQGNLSARVVSNRTDEIGMLASAFNSMTDQLQSSVLELEQRINERTADLQNSTLKLETISDVAREISIIRDMDTLFKVSVDLIRKRFAYYHVGIFLVDERNEYAILRAASSVAAEKMLAENYKLKVGQTGLVGNVTRTGQAYIALDAGTDVVHFENPLLPETKSEIVLPLRSHNITIGALDIQSNTAAAFDDKDAQTFQILADQLAAAIENAQLAQQIEGNLAALTIANRLQTQQTWRATKDQRDHTAFEYDGLQVKAVPQNLPADLLKQLESGKPIVINQTTEVKIEGNKSKNTLMIPLLVLNQVIGVIGLEQEDPNYIWTDEDIALAQAAANRAALTLDNARLLEESQRRAIKERTIFESTTRVGSALNIENILQATADEVERVLSGAEVIIQFQSEHDQKFEK